MKIKLFLVILCASISTVSSGLYTNNTGENEVLKSISGTQQLSTSQSENRHFVYDSIESENQLVANLLKDKEEIWKMISYDLNEKNLTIITPSDSKTYEYTLNDNKIVFDYNSDLYDNEHAKLDGFYLEENQIIIKINVNYSSKWVTINSVVLVKYRLSNDL